MISVFRLQQGYINFYKAFREYIWNYKVVETLVDLETEIYKSCPDMTQLKAIAAKLKSNIYDIMIEDDSLKDSFEELENMILDSSEACYPINIVNEVIQDEDK